MRLFSVKKRTKDIAAKARYEFIVRASSNDVIYILKAYHTTVLLGSGEPGEFDQPNLSKRLVVEEGQSRNERFASIHGDVMAH